MSFRFRKSIPIIPPILYFTVSKTGFSVNLHLGLFSKSWGTMGETSTVDMPGTSGMSWRKQHRWNEAEKEALHQKFWRGVGTMILFAAAVAVVGRGQLHAWQGAHGAHLVRTPLIFGVGALVGMRILWECLPVIRGIRYVPLAALVAAAVWLLS